MFQKLKNKMKDQRGLTLIELLAVIVILAIISAIAIPSILGLINNSKKDAHVANAQQFVNSAKLAVAGDDNLRPAPGGTVDIPVADLVTKGYLETINDPDSSGTPYAAGSKVVVTATSAGKISYSIFLDGSAKDIGTAADPAEENELKRSKVSP